MKNYLKEKKEQLREWIIFKILKYPKLDLDVIEFSKLIQNQKTVRRLTKTNKEKHFSSVKDNLQDLRFHITTECCDNYSKSVAAEIAARLMLITNE
jgi:hypothetical protein